MIDKNYNNYYPYLEYGLDVRNKLNKLLIFHPSKFEPKWPYFPNANQDWALGYYTT